MESDGGAFRCRSRIMAHAVAIGMIAAAACIPAAVAETQPAGPPLDRSTLPIVPGPFRGVIGETFGESKLSVSRPVNAPAGAPNILLVMTDDIGFGAVSTFGGPVPTPNLDRLANMGLRYTRFHTTGVCSPSRAALLTGRNHHSVGFGEVGEMASGFPAYTGEIPRDAANIARILTGNGYASAFFGKDHNIPMDQTSAAGPFDLWPTGQGFDYFYGFLGGDVDQWSPKLYRGTNPVDNPPGETGEILDKRLTDDAIRWVRNVNAASPDKPFFIYYAPGSGHAPHQAPPDWIAKFRGKYDKGWDSVREASFKRQKALGIIPKNTRLAPRPTQVPAWESLTPEMKGVHARYMEVFAAQVAYQDDQFGRMLDELERMGQLDNTLVIFIEGDNGGTAQSGPRPVENEIGQMANRLDQTDAEFADRLDLYGGPETYGVYSVGWGFAMNSPFPYFKHVPSHLGATRNGMVVAWPSSIKATGEVRTTFSHLVDILPTVLDAAKIPAADRGGWHRAATDRRGVLAAHLLRSGRQPGSWSSISSSPGTARSTRMDGLQAPRRSRCRGIGEWAARIPCPNGASCTTCEAISARPGIWPSPIPTS